MANPKRKTSGPRQGSRRSHHALTPPPSAKCRQCGQPKTPHTVCRACGHYDRGRPIIEAKA